MVTREYGEAQPGSICSNKPFCLFQLSLCLLPLDIQVRFKGGELTKKSNSPATTLKYWCKVRYEAYKSPRCSRWSYVQLTGDQK